MAIPKTWKGTGTYTYDDYIQSPWATGERDQALAEISRLNAELKLMQQRLRESEARNLNANIALWGTVRDGARVGIFRIRNASHLTNGANISSTNIRRVDTDQIIWFDSVEEADEFTRFAHEVIDLAT